MRMHITLNVNAKQRGLEPEPSVSLLDVRREHLDLTGSKSGGD
jgi:aerobic-type carbon monoxide dehydrogenase small subunit (CoxS/CutS family)